MIEETPRIEDAQQLQTTMMAIRRFYRDLAFHHKADRDAWRDIVIDAIENVVQDLEKQVEEYLDRQLDR